MARGSLVLIAAAQPRATASWSASDWDLLVRQARRSNLLGNLAFRLEAEDMLASAPPAAQAHLNAARILAQHQQKAVEREVAAIRQSLAATGIDIILLKGAAYAIAGLRAAKGRIFSDIDILVPKHALLEIESALMRHGWVSTHHDPYDQRYYRMWMHELPPMRHIIRQTVIDVHHAILPETARLKPDSAKLRAAAVPLEGKQGLFVFSPADMVLHSATHLFHDGELENGLRDLFDLDSLLREFSQKAGFWEILIARSAELHLKRPLYYALHYASLVLGTPVPVQVLQAATAGKPMSPVDHVMDALFLRALYPAHLGVADRLTAAARQILYVRSHWLRMPPLLLFYHLAIKAFSRRRPHE
jgi:Uncharacterised nucleotidyltransferase